LQPSRQGLTEPYVSSRPFETVGFDIVGPLPEDRDGNKYLLTVVDHYSRYPLAIPITNREQSTVIHALHRHVVCVFGPPSRFVSDREQSFVSGVTKGLFELMGVAMSHTTAYHPQTNGSCERFHRYLSATLTMFVNEHKTDWSDFVDSILFAYRTSICSSTGYTPFELMFGRKATMPPDIVYGVASKQLANEAQRRLTVSKAMQTASRFVRSRQLRAASLNKSYRDRGRVAVSFKNGDLVWQFDRSADTKGPQKFQFRYSGPYIVQQRSSRSDNLYVLSEPSTSKVFTCNVNQLVPVHHECSDLGLPLGWSGLSVHHPSSNQSDDTFLEPSSFPPTFPRHSVVSAPTPPSPSVGDMVALLVAPDAVEQMPFAVGQILSKENNVLQVRWYGTRSGNVLGAWRPGFYQPSDDRRYYSDRRDHFSHLPLTSEVTETILTIDHVIGVGFSLNRRDAIPASILAAVSACEEINWTLPDGVLAAFLASPSLPDLAH
jgi:transposase InsO family protein